MNLGVIVLQLLPVALAVAAAAFVYLSTPRQRIAVLLAFLFPGLGHWWLGFRSRALLFGGCLSGLFLFGMILGDFAVVSPFDRHPIWGLAQIPGGLMTLSGWLVSGQANVSSVYSIACLYVGSACLMNIIAMCDAWDLAQDDAKSAGGDASPAGSENP